MSRLLDRLNANNSSGLAFQRLWERNCVALESQITDLFAALSSMPDIPDVRIDADYTGAVISGELPISVYAYRYSGDTDNTADATWGFTTNNGGISASISLGVLTITAIAGTTVVTITSTYNGVAQSRTFTVYLDVAAPPSTGGATGGTSASTSTFTNFNSASYAAVTGELNVTTGSVGTVDLAAPLRTKINGSPSDGVYEVKGIWRWWNGASWVDVGTEVASAPDAERDDGDNHNGQIAVTAQKTGLAASSTAKFKLYAKNTSGTQSMYFTGTASAVAS